MLGCARSKTLTALGLIILMFGCDSSVRMPISPSTATPTPRPAPTPSPAPAPPNPIADSVLSGVVFGVAATGRTPLEGATVYLLSCGAVNCPVALTTHYEVTTGNDGVYRIAGVYNGDLNFLWVTREGYALVDPMPAGTCPDGCDRVVTINGDTRLDIDLVRR